LSLHLLLFSVAYFLKRKLKTQCNSERGSRQGNSGASSDRNLPEVWPLALAKVSWLTSRTVPKDLSYLVFIHFCTFSYTVSESDCVTHGIQQKNGRWHLSLSHKRHGSFCLPFCLDCLFQGKLAAALRNRGCQQHWAISEADTSAPVKPSDDCSPADITATPLKIQSHSPQLSAQIPDFQKLYEIINNQCFKFWGILLWSSK
jgi:hypothetical protein